MFIREQSRRESPTLFSTLTAEWRHSRRKASMQSPEKITIGIMQLIQPNRK